MSKLLLPGTETQARLAATPLKRELIYDTDLDIVFVGDGATPGGKEIGSVQEAGGDGLSAYQIAETNGFVGTESEWLASLEGEPGPSAYQLAVTNGFTGTSEEWLESLEGEPGQPGPAGSVSAASALIFDQVASGTDPGAGKTALYSKDGKI